MTFDRQALHKLLEVGYQVVVVTGTANNGALSWAGADVTCGIKIGKRQ